MTRNRVADEALGRFARFQHDIFERVRKGSLDPHAVMQATQGVINVKPPTTDEPRVIPHVGPIKPIRLKPPLVPKRYPITIDYGKTFEARVADGGYDWKNNDITAKRFPLTGTGTVEVATELIHFNRSISSDDALAELDRMGYRAATIEELLAFGAKYPEKQREFPIVAPGSVTRRVAGRYVAGLWRDGNGRSLDLGWFEDDWDGSHRFLAVRKAA